MTLANILVIFGAPDFEEQKAREICRSLNVDTATATFNNEPCHAGNAYKANGFILDEWSMLPEEPVIILFECGASAATNLPVGYRCDHHNPGDPGFGIPAELFWQGSSLGQLCNLFTVQATPELLLIAASDHCPADAYQGRCPGIDVEEFKYFRIKQRLEFFQTQPEKFPLKQTMNDLERAILIAQKHLLSAPEISGFRDLRENGYIDELPEAALSLGVAYISKITERSTGKTKIICGGHTTPEMIGTFQTWAGDQSDVVEVYGDPVRGYAGAVLR